LGITAGCNKTPAIGVYVMENNFLTLRSTILRIFDFHDIPTYDPIDLEKTYLPMDIQLLPLGDWVQEWSQIQPIEYAASIGWTRRDYPRIL
jgi:hypothetical protein